MKIISNYLPGRISSTNYHIWKKILLSYIYWITTVFSFPLISSPVVVAVVCLADAVHDVPSPEEI